MQIGCLAVIGLILGALLGAAVGVGLGLAYTKIFNVSDREGYAGMLVFLTFMPVGAILGGLGGAVTMGLLAAKKPAEPPSNSDKIQ
jgi:ABC-type lipoprotein release transport system permease subunit